MIPTYYHAPTSSEGSDRVRGSDEQTKDMFSYLSPEQRVRQDRPLRAIRRLTDDVAMIRATAGMVPRDSLELDESKNVVQTLVLRKDGGDWRIVLFQNTPARLDGRPEAVAAMSDELRAAAQQQLRR